MHFLVTVYIVIRLANSRECFHFYIKILFIYFENTYNIECENGYFVQTGDVPNWGSVNGVGGGGSVSSCSVCATYCDNDDDCNSYECSDSYKRCSLNYLKHPTAGPYGDYYFCSKMRGVFYILRFQVLT